MWCGVGVGSGVSGALAHWRKEARDGVAEFAAGSYIVTISTDAGVYTENVVIK